MRAFSLRMARDGGSFSFSMMSTHRFETAARVINTLGNVGDREIVGLLSTDLWRRRALHAPIIRALRLIRSDVAIDTLADMLARAPDEQAGDICPLEAPWITVWLCLLFVDGEAVAAETTTFSSLKSLYR